MRSRILVIEEDPLNLELVRDLLEHRGHQVIEAATLEEGRTAARQQPPDMILVEIDTVAGNGEVVIQQLRQDPALDRLPIIAVTSCFIPGDGERLQRIGFTAHKNKPFNTRTFGLEIESYLQSTGPDAR